MSTPKLGEFFTTLIGCAIERCQQGEPQTLRTQLGRLAYLTLGYAPTSWIDQVKGEGGLDDQAQSLLVAQLDRHLAPLSPSWLDRVQLKSMIHSTIRLFQTYWNDRQGLVREVCHIFSLTRDDLLINDVSSVATLAPHLQSMLMAKAWSNRNTPPTPTSLCPLPPEYTMIHPLYHQQTYWKALVSREGLTMCLEMRRVSELEEARLLFKSLAHKRDGWAPITRRGQIDEWVWLERPAQFHLDLITHHQKPLDHEQVILILLPVLRGLAELHRSGGVCGRLTPQMILLDHECQAHLGDRLLWCTQENSRISLKGANFTYWSPELFKEDAHFTPQADLWAFGLILYQLLCGSLPWFAQHRPNKIIQAIHKTDQKIWLRTPQILHSFLTRCFSLDPKQRWSNATQALEMLQDIAEKISPLLKGQRLSQQWRHIIETNATQRFIEETPILPTDNPEQEFARFLKKSSQTNEMTSDSLQSLFPRLVYLHQKWWSNQARIQETYALQENSLKSFRESLTQIAPESLFQQLTVLSQQKEALETRYNHQLKRLKRERDSIKTSVIEHTKDTLLNIWIQLGLPSDLIPHWRESKINPTSSATKSELSANVSQKDHKNTDTQQSVAHYNNSKQISQEIPQEISASQISSPVVESPPTDSRSLAGDIKYSVIAPAAAPYPIDDDQDEQQDNSFFKLPNVEEFLQNIDSTSQMIPTHLIQSAEEALRSDVHSTPPKDLVERLDEFSARKIKIDQSRPVIAVSPPEYSTPPSMYPPEELEEVFSNMMTSHFDQTEQDTNQDNPEYPSTEQRSRASDDLIKAINLEEIEAVQLEEIEAVQLEEIEAVQLEEIEAINLEEIEAINLEEIEAINLEEIEAINLEEIEAINLEEIEVINLAEIGMINLEEIGVINLEEIGAINLEEINLEEINLEEINLEVMKETPLQDTTLQETPLQETPLQETPLQETPLQETPLQETNLQEANLEEISLEEINLEETNLEEINLEEIDLEEIDLEELEEINLEELEEVNLQEIDTQNTRTNPSSVTHVQAPPYPTLKTIDPSEFPIPFSHEDFEGNFSEEEIPSLDSPKDEDTQQESKRTTSKKGEMLTSSVSTQSNPNNDLENSLSLPPAPGLLEEEDFFSQEEDEDQESSDAWTEIGTLNWDEINIAEQEGVSLPPSAQPFEKKEKEEE